MRLQLVIDLFIVDPSVHGINRVDTRNLGDTPYPLPFMPYCFQGKETIWSKMVKHLQALFGQAIQCHHFWSTSEFVWSLSVLLFCLCQGNFRTQSQMAILLSAPSLLVSLFWCFQGNTRTHPKWPDMCLPVLEKLFSATISGAHQASDVTSGLMTSFWLHCFAISKATIAHSLKWPEMCLLCLERLFNAII